MKKSIFVTIAAFLSCFGIVARTVPDATFSYFTYTGNDPRYDKQIDPDNQYLNPILAGYYPDPSVCSKGETYYLVNSSFSFFPGVPIFESNDLVNWKQIGHVLDRPSQLDLQGQNVSQGGIYAPAIEYNKYNDTFYMITTNLARGNFFVKTKDPHQGWSEPIYLPQIDGIDPSFFFDKNGKAYIVHNAPVIGKEEYQGQRAIRMFEFDVNNDSIIGGPYEIIRGGTTIKEHPIWIEGPHLYRIGKYYYLMCAEDGTGENHSEVIFRAKNPKGPWEEYPGNPILTQREGVDPFHKEAVSCTGHADIIRTKEGDWWAVFLGCRPYEFPFYNTGRDTYLLPVTWKDGWPVILDKGITVPTVVDKPGLQHSDNSLRGNFSYTDRFDGDKFNMRWIFLRNPKMEDFSLGTKGLTIHARDESIWKCESPSAIFCRQQHTCFEVETEITFSPQSENELAGLTLLQNEEHNFVFGLTMLSGCPALTLTRTQGDPIFLASSFVNIDKPIKLRITGNGRYYDFSYSSDDDSWQYVAKGVDALNLSTTVAGGFIGTCIGLYATTAHNK